MLAITISGMYAGFTDRTLFFDPGDEYAFAGKLNTELTRINTAQFPLKPPEQIFMIARRLYLNVPVTWIGLYGAAIDPMKGREGGFKSVGVWLHGTSLRPRRLLPILRNALVRLNEAIDDVSWVDWKANFYDLTAAELGFGPLALNLLGDDEKPLTQPDWQVSADSYLIDLSEESADTMLLHALREVQSGHDFTRFDKVYLTTSSRLVEAGRRDSSLKILRFNSNEAEQTLGAPDDGSSSVAGRSIAAIAARTQTAAMVQDDSMNQFRVLREDVRLEAGQLSTQVNVASNKLADQIASEANKIKKLFYRQLVIIIFIQFIAVFSVAAVYRFVDGIGVLHHPSSPAADSGGAVPQNLSLADQRKPELPPPPAAKPVATAPAAPAGATIASSPPAAVTDVMNFAASAADPPGKPLDTEKLAKDLRDVKDQLTKVNFQLAKNPSRQQDLMSSVTKAQDLIDRFLDGLPKLNPTQPGSGSPDTGSNTDTGSFKTIDPSQSRPPNASRP